MIERNYWAVGATFGKRDVSEEFIERGIWYDGHADSGDEKYREQWSQVAIGDVLVIKSAATKGKGNKISFTRLKAIGKVKSKQNDYTFNVAWQEDNHLPMDFEGIYYAKTIEPLRNDPILKYVLNITESMDISHYINLLETKRQIILQGPPGTGKTRLADKIASQIAQEMRVEAKELDMEAFIKNFKLTDEVKSFRRKREQVLNQFLSKYPLESIDDLGLEEYCVGRGDNDSFCWWLETGLKELGKFFPGNSGTYRIYWSKKRDAFIKSGYIKDIEDDEKAVSRLVTDIQNFLNKKDPSLMGNKLGRALIIKLLQTYYPEDYFPINGPDHIDNALKLFKIDAGDTTYYERNQLLNKEVKRLIAEHNSQANVYDVMWWMYENYNLKLGEQEEGGKIVVSGHKKMIQFHPAYTYEDFVRGIIVEIENKETSYEVQNKVLAAYAKDALENPNAKYVLIIDEINRANLPAVLGELIYALEYRGKAVESMYEYDKSREIILPKNLYIIGTMNTADRSVGHIDYAIRRRFAFVPVLPKILDEPETDFRKDEFIAVSKLFIEGGIENKTIEQWKGAEYLSKEFEPQDICLGHSYFIGTPENFKNIRWPYEIKLILEEYIKDGILNTDAKEYIAQLNEQFV